VPEGAASRLIEKTGCGVAVTEPDSREIQITLRDLLDCLRNGKPLFPPAEENELACYERSAVVGRLAELLDRQ
jgi:hypothetical protein